MHGAVRNVLNRWALLLFILLAVFTLAGFCGALWWGFDICSHFRAQYVVCALLVSLLLFALGRWRWALAALAVLAANLVPIVLLYIPAEAAPNDARAIRVIAANVYKDNDQIQKVLDYVRRENPDVLVLLEINEKWVQPLEKLARRYPFRWIHPGSVYTGIAVLARTIPVETRSMVLAGAGTAAYLVTLAGDDGQRLSILGTHLRVPWGAKEAAARDRQLAALASVAREHPWPLLIVGDLNVTQFSPLFARMLRDGGLTSCAGKGLQPTWPVALPPLYIQIDHCLVTSRAQAWNFRVGPDVGSDHFPLSVKVRPAR